MASMYDTPAQSNIINTYQPIPFEEMLQAGQARQSRYDETLSALQAQEDALARLPYVAGGEEEAYVKGVISDVDTLARQAINKDLSQGMNRRWLQNSLRNKVDLNLLSTITRNKEAYDKAREAEFQLRRDNQYYEPYEMENDPYKNIQNFKLGQTYNYLPQAMTDPDTVLAKYFEAIPEDAYTYVDPNTGQVKDVVAKTKEKLLSALANDADTLALNPSMKWMVEQYRRNHPEAKDMTTREIVMKRAEQAIKGNRFTFYRSRDAGFIPGMGRANTDVSGFAASNNTQKITNANRIAEGDFKELTGINPKRIKEATDIFDDAKYENNKLVREIAKKPKLAGSAVWNQARQQAKLDEKYNKRKKILDDIRKFNPGLSDTSDPELLSAYVKAYKDLDKVDYNTYMFNPAGGADSPKKVQTDLIRDDLGGRRIVSGETKYAGGVTLENLDDLYTEYGIKKDSKERDPENIKITSVVPALGMYQASIPINGVPRNFMISMNKEEQAITRVAKEANKLNDSGKVGETKVIGGDGRKYIVATGLQKFEDPITKAISYGFGSNVRTADGEAAFIDPETGEKTNNLPLDYYEQFVASQLNSIY